MKETFFTIGMGEYAYIDEDILEDRGVYALETPGINSCFGVALYSDISGNVGLIHADIDKLNQLEYAFNDIFSSTDSSFDVIEFYTSSEGLNYLKDEGTGDSLEDLEDVLRMNPEADVIKNIGEESVDLRVEYEECITETEIDKDEVDRLNDNFSLKNLETKNNGELITDPLN